MFILRDQKQNIFQCSTLCYSAMCAEYIVCFAQTKQYISLVERYFSSFFCCICTSLYCISVILQCVPSILVYCQFCIDVADGAAPICSNQLIEFPLCRNLPNSENYSISTATGHLPQGAGCATRNWFHKRGKFIQKCIFQCIFKSVFSKSAGTECASPPS